MSDFEDALASTNEKLAASLAALGYSDFATPLEESISLVDPAVEHWFSPEAEAAWGLVKKLARVGAAVADLPAGRQLHSEYDGWVLCEEVPGGIRVMGTSDRLSTLFGIKED